MSTPPYLVENNSSTTFHTSVSSFTHFAPTLTLALHSQSSLGHDHSIKSRYPDPYSDNPFLPLKDLRRLRSSEILSAKLDDEDSHTPGCTASDEDISNVDVSPTGSPRAHPYTSYFARTRRDSIDSGDDGFSSDVLDNGEPNEKDISAKAPAPCTPPRKRPPPIRVGNQAPSSISEAEEDDVVGSPPPRSVKLSSTSAFSLSLFPPTPTTPMNRQSWVRSARTSVDGSSLSSIRPIAFSTPRRSTCIRPSYRATMEIDRPRETLFKPGRASVDAPPRPHPSDTSYTNSFYSAGRSNGSGHEPSFMRSDSAFETCAESFKDGFAQSRVFTPTRKPVPRIDPDMIEMAVPPRSSLPSPTSTAHSKPKLRKKQTKGHKLVISHPHTDKSSQTTLSNTTLPIGPKVTHSDSIGSLRDELLGNAIKHKHKRKRGKKPFDKYTLPNQDQLQLASDMFVYDQTNRPIRFGDIFKDQKTAICFIRHFWCPLCQDYMSSIVHLTEPSLVQKAGVKLVIIGNGASNMIQSYNAVFNCPYEMYTDPGRNVYNALGMTLRTNNGGTEWEKGSYVKHGTFTGTMMVLKRALKMPLANAGDIKQLGGEFILGPGLTCSFASRMHTTRSHTPIRDLLHAAGVPITPSATHLDILGSSADSARWTDAQNEDMDNMIRKGLGVCNCPLEDPKPDLGEFRRLIERLNGSGPHSLHTLV